MITRLMCHRCGLRYIQSRGLCRTCGRASGLDTRTTFERERDPVAGRADGLMRVVGPPPGGWHRTLVVDGVEYEVTWDGTQ